MLKSVLLLGIVLLVEGLDLEEYLYDEQTDPEKLFKSYEPNFKKSSSLDTFIFYTPWNKQGKDLVQKYAAKLDYVCPCWYEVNIVNGKVVLEHQSNYDRQYVRQLKTTNPKIKILPRVYVPNNNIRVLQAVGSNRQAAGQLLLEVGKVSTLEGIDGIVWDTPFTTLSTDNRYKQINQVMKYVINGIKQTIGTKLLYVNIPGVHNIDVGLLKQLKFDGLMIQNYAGNQNKHETQYTIQSINSMKLNNLKIVIVLPFFSKVEKGQMISTQDVWKRLEQSGLRKAWVDVMCIYDASANLRYHVPCYNYFSKKFQTLKNAGFTVGFWQAGNGLQIYYSFI